MSRGLTACWLEDVDNGMDRALVHIETVRGERCIGRELRLRQGLGEGRPPLSREVCVEVSKPGEGEK